MLPDFTGFIQSLQSCVNVSQLLSILGSSVGVASSFVLTHMGVVKISNSFVSAVKDGHLSLVPRSTGVIEPSLPSSNTSTPFLVRKASRLREQIRYAKDRGDWQKVDYLESKLDKIYPQLDKS